MISGEGGRLPEKLSKAAPGRGPWDLVQPWIALILILLLAGALRLSNLEAPEPRREEIEIQRSLLENRTVHQAARDQFEAFPETREMPLVWTGSLGIKKVFGSSGERFRSLRLPFAILGSLTILALWWLGFELAGRSLATILAVLGAVNPFHIYWSRTAESPVVSIFFLTLFAAALVRALEKLRGGGEVERSTLLLLSVGAIGAGLTAAYTWTPLLVGWGLFVWSLVGSGKAERTSTPPTAVEDAGGAEVSSEGGGSVLLPSRRRRSLWAGPIVCAVVLLPWAFLLIRSFGETAVATAGEAEDLWRLPFIYLFGGAWRSVLSLGLPLIAVVAVFLRRDAEGSRLRRVTLGILAASGLLLPCLWFSSASGPDGFVPLWPLLLILAAVGVQQAGSWLDRRWALRPLPVAAAALLLAGPFLAAPVRVLSALKGNPWASKDLVEVMESPAHRGLPALVTDEDLYFVLQAGDFGEEVELVAPYAGAEEERTVDGNRRRAEALLKRFSDAIVVRRSPTAMSRQPPWTFPDEHFARKTVVENVPGLTLEAWLSAPLNGFYSGATRTEILFNTEEDLLSTARREGRRTLLLWGEGWRFGSSSGGDEGRILEDRGELRLFNLSDQRAEVRVVLEVLLTQGRKRVRVNRQEVTVSPRANRQNLAVTLAIPPGETKLPMEDELWPWGRMPMLVLEARMEPVAP